MATRLEQERRKTESNFIGRLNEKLGNGDDSEKEDIIGKLQSCAVGSRYWKMIRAVAIMLIVILVIGFMLRVFNYSAKNFVQLKHTLSNGSKKS